MSSATSSPHTTATAAVVGLHLELATDDGQRFELDVLVSALQDADRSLAAYTSPGFGIESKDHPVNPLAHIDLYWSESDGSSLSDFMGRVQALVERLLAEFRQRAVGFSVLLTDDRAQWSRSGTVSREQPWNLAALATLPRGAAPFRTVQRVLIVALRDAGSTDERGNEMLFYSSKDWRSVMLVPAPEISDGHPALSDGGLLRSILLKRIKVDPNAWPDLEVRLLDGVRSSEIKPTWDRVKALKGQLARYEFRIAWCELPEEVAVGFDAHRELSREERSRGLPAFATLKEVSADDRNLAANWDVIHCLERHFDGHLITVPPNDSAGMIIRP